MFGTGRHLRVTLSGSDSAVVGAEIFNDQLHGIIREIAIRQSVGGGATSLNMFLAHSVGELADYVTVPPGELVAVAVGNHTPTPSATTPSLRSPIDRQPAFDAGLGVILDVTGSGAWTITVGVTVADQIIGGTN